MKNLIFSLVALSLTISGCTKMSEALNGTVDLPGKIDETNTNMKETIRKLDQTRSETGSNMGVTNGGIHRQTLLLALDDLLKARNTKDLTLPVKMFAAGTQFAESVTLDELVKFMYVYITDINQQQADDAELVDGKYPEAYIKEFNRTKKAEFLGLQIVAAFTPQNIIEDLVRTQIKGQGRYERVAYAILAMRARFVGEVLLYLDLLDSEDHLFNLGTVEEALNRAEILKYLANLLFHENANFTAKGYIGKSGASDSSQNESVKIDVEQAQSFIAETKSQSLQVLKRILADTHGQQISQNVVFANDDEKQLAENFRRAQTLLARTEAL